MALRDRSASKDQRDPRVSRVPGERQAHRVHQERRGSWESLGSQATRALLGTRETRALQVSKVDPETKANEAIQVFQENEANKGQGASVDLEAEEERLDFLARRATPVNLDPQVPPVSKDLRGLKDLLVSLDHQVLLEWMARTAS